MEKIPNTNKDEEPIDEIDPLTPPGAGGEPTPPNPPDGTLLKPEDEEDFKQFQEIKKTTGFTKFSESANEAIRLRTELIKKEEALTEKELIAMDPEYESMTDEEKADFRKEKQNEKRIKTLEAKDKWREDYRKLPPDIKKLIDEKGGEDAFGEFACDPSRAGADLLTLARAFTFDAVKPALPQDKKPGLEIKGGGGQPPKPVKEGYTAEEAENLRKTKPALYAKLVQTHRLKIIDK